MRKPAILVIDDEVEVGTFFEYYLTEERGYPVDVANSGREARALLQEKKFDLALVDLKLPDTDGITLLREIKEVNPACEVIIMTGYSTVKTAVEAMKLGALDYIDKPFEELDELDRIIDHAVYLVSNKKQFADEEVEKLASEYGIVTSKDSPFNNLLLLCKKVATRKISILIEGETGTGKEVLARFIHANSTRADFPFISINCGALTETLLESELFGHERGAFTGAQGLRHGIFELAHKGTLFLDEVGEATPAIQVKLLRVLESGEFFRVGAEKPIKSDVRIIAATNKNLREAARSKLFREDLLYRLDVVCVNVPPLRERRMDILPLTNYFIGKNLPAEDARGKAEFNPEARQLLREYDWPGNVRELSNVVARAMAIREGRTMGPECLPNSIAFSCGGKFSEPAGNPAGQDLKAAVRELSQRFRKVILDSENIDIKEVSSLLKSEADSIIKDIIESALEKTGHNRMAAARLLNVSPRILRYLLNEKK
ncbi:sigma-54-dependent transcriptional regulator [Pelotomaculum propionicicum]|uniref:Stage 0 sporulation protein A homolog n=1 Tax=Pelotomaculum propionicicum TaxID=258475 RepID=A0A4Y7RVG5_9FIRM|nr:sigma-54 dependent transcriptional regulator [Pelotomaculum propionicicum]NLI12049.1 sigma-54-dependent Fis family transcriptional regulator [Peptococcaceae bacterium]TEB13008.1 Transcriptional regulatory protein ZraR [Pelotomaculum propionicicum]